MPESTPPPAILPPATRSPALRLLAASIFLAACGGGSQAPPMAVPPSGSTGGRTLVVPAQRVVGVAGDVDGELAFALRARGGGNEWVFPREARRALAASPGLDAPLDNLPVDIFLRAEVTRVGDPLYGMIRRVAAVTDAQRVLIPVAVAPRTEEDPGDGREADPAVEVLAALVDVRSGRVVWAGVVHGSGGPDDPGALAGAMEALARTVVPGSPR